MTTDSKWSIRVIGNDLIVRNEETFDEYIRTIDADLCCCSSNPTVQHTEGSIDTCKAVAIHPIFAFPNTVNVIHTIISAPDVSTQYSYKITVPAESKYIVTVTFDANVNTAVSSTFSVDIHDRLIVDCRARDGNPEIRAIAKLNSVTTRMHAIWRSRRKQSRASWSRIAS